MLYVLSEPAIYHLDITAACDHACPGCSNTYARVRAHPPTSLSADAWETLLARIAPGAAAFRLTGGEPTLHPEFPRILRVATSYDAWVTLSTHGHWRDPDATIDLLVATPNLAGLLLSLHGATPATHEAFNRTPGSFAATVDNARRAAERGLQVALSTVITHWNWGEVEVIAALAGGIGAQEVVFNRYVGPARPAIEPTPDELRAAVACIEALSDASIGGAVHIRYGIGIPPCFVTNRSEGCLAGSALAAVDPWGNLRPCSFSPTVIGSLLEQPVHTLWQSSDMDMWRAQIPAVCERGCRAFAQCHGGCWAAQELRADRCDPLRRAPLGAYAPPVVTCELPGAAKPIADVRCRAEAFGYALLGRGRVVPVRPEAHALVLACDGTRSFADLVAEYGESCLNLLGELWEAGLLSSAPGEMVTDR